MSEVKVWVGDGIPYAEKLNSIIVEMISLRERIDAISASMAVLCDAGVFLDGDCRPVVPSLSERRENGRVVGYVQIWPTAYAREAGIKRRKYVRKGDVGQVRARIERTKEYAGLERQRSQLRAQLSLAGERLDGVFNRYGRQW